MIDKIKLQVIKLLKMILQRLAEVSKIKSHIFGFTSENAEE